MRLEDMMRIREEGAARGSRVARGSGRRNDRLSLRPELKCESSSFLEMGRPGNRGAGYPQASYCAPRTAGPPCSPKAGVPIV
jgi:hypothetical protein